MTKEEAEKYLDELPEDNIFGITKCISPGVEAYNMSTDKMIIFTGRGGAINFLQSLDNYTKTLITK